MSYGNNIPPQLTMASTSTNANDEVARHLQILRDNGFENDDVNRILLEKWKNAFGVMHAYVNETPLQIMVRNGFSDEKMNCAALDRFEGNVYAAMHAIYEGRFAHSSSSNLRAYRPTASNHSSDGNTPSAPSSSGNSSGSRAASTIRKQMFDSKAKIVGKIGDIEAETVRVECQAESIKELGANSEPGLKRKMIGNIDEMVTKMQASMTNLSKIKVDLENTSA